MTSGWLTSPPPGWDDLCRDAAGVTAAHRPELAIALAATQPGFSAEWLAVESQGRLLGGLPVVFERRAGFHWIHAMPFGLPGAPLCREGVHAEVDRAAAAALESRARELGAVGGAWVFYRPDGPACETATLELVNGETRVLESSLLDLGGGVPAAWERVDRDTRTAIRHARRHGLRFGEDPEALEEAYTLYVAQARGWAGHRPRPLELWRRLTTARDGTPPSARVFTVRDAHGLLSSVLTLVSQRDALVWLTGAHPAARSRHAFAVLLWSVAEWCEARGVVRLNLGGSAPGTGIATYKERLGARRYRHPVRWIGPAHAGPIGWLVRGLQDRFRGGQMPGEPA